MENGNKDGNLVIKVELEEEVPVTSTPRTRNTLSSSLKREVKKPGKKSFYYVQKFRKEWLDDKEFQPWLEEIGDVSKCRCIWCQKDLHAKLHELKRHKNTKKHRLIADQYRNATRRYGRKIKEEPNTNPRAHIVNILKDISSEEDLEDTKISISKPYNEKDEGSVNPVDLSQFERVQSERNDIMKIFIRVQNKRLKLNQQQLSTAKNRLAVQQRLLNTLKCKSFIKIM